MAVMIAAMAVATSLVVASGPAAAAGPGFIRNVRYNQCMDLANGDSRNGTPIGNYQCVAGGSQWYVDDMGVRALCVERSIPFPLVCLRTADYPVVRIKSAATGKCLDIYQQRTDSGAPLHLWDCHDGLSQLRSSLYQYMTQGGVALFAPLLASVVLVLVALNAGALMVIRLLWPPRVPARAGRLPGDRVVRGGSAPAPRPA